MANPWDNDPEVGAMPWDNDPDFADPRPTIKKPTDGSIASRAFNTVWDAGAAIPQVAGEAWRGLKDAYRGPEGLPEAAEFDPPSDEMTPEQQRAMLIWSNFSIDPVGQAEIIAKAFPDAKITEIPSDRGPYYMMDWQSPKGQKYTGYLNAPGFSGRDIQQGLAIGAAFTPAGRGGVGRGLMGRSAVVGGKSAGTSIGLDVASQYAGSEQPIDMGRAATAFAAGALFEGLSPLAARVWQNVITKRQYIDPATGELTKAGRNYARVGGLTNDEIDAMSARIKDQYIKDVRNWISPDMAAAKARVGEFDIPATMGALTKDPRLLTLEKAMYSGNMGPYAQNIMRKFKDEIQPQAIERARTQVQQNLAGEGRHLMTTAQEGAETLASGLKAREGAARQAVGGAYRAVEDAGPAYVKPEAFSALSRNITEALEGRAVDRTLTPGTVAALREIEAMTKGPATSGAFQPKYAGVEVTRRKINSLIDSVAADPARRADYGNLLQIKRSYDRWLEEAFDAGLVDADPAIISLLKAARASNARKEALYGIRGSKDAGGKAIDDVLRNADSPERVVDIIFGRGSLGSQKGVSTTLPAVQRLKQILNNDPNSTVPPGVFTPEWSAVRQMAWERMTHNAKGKPLTGKEFDNVMIDIERNNPGLLAELFTPLERAMIRRYRTAMNTAYGPDPNPSGTATSLANIMQYLMRRTGTAMTFRGNPMGGAIMHSLARIENVPGVAPFAQSRMANRAIGGLRETGMKSPWFVGGGVAGSQLYPNQEPLPYREPR